jgi:hypothetical protein
MLITEDVAYHGDGVALNRIHGWIVVNEGGEQEDERLQRALFIGIVKLMHGFLLSQTGMVVVVGLHGEDSVGEAEVSGLEEKDGMKIEEWNDRRSRLIQALVYKNDLILG